MQTIRIVQCHISCCIALYTVPHISISYDTSAHINDNITLLNNYFSVGIIILSL